MNKENGVLAESTLASFALYGVGYAETGAVLGIPSVGVSILCMSNLLITNYKLTSSLTTF